jgi:hypothetical protein
MPKIPSVSNLQTHYPTGTVEEVAKLVGGTVEKNLLNAAFTAYKDTCAIRVSRALNYGGDPIPYIGNIDNPYVKGKLRTNKGSDDKRYIYSTYDMRVYLNMRFGYGKKFKSTATAAVLASVKGIIAFGFLHIDNWDGTGCSRSCYFGDSRITNDNIYVWETN